MRHDLKQALNLNRTIPSISHYIPRPVVMWGAGSAGLRSVRSICSEDAVRQRGAGRQAVPLAATQDTSGDDRQDPCPVLQPLAQPKDQLQHRATTDDQLWGEGEMRSQRGREGGRDEVIREGRFTGLRQGWKPSMNTYKLNEIIRKKEDFKNIHAGVQLSCGGGLLH